MGERGSEEQEGETKVFVCVYAYALTIQEEKTKVSGSIQTHLPFSRLQQPVTPQIT